MIFGWVFIPWVMLKAWIRPLPDTVQEQIDLSLDYDLDGVIVYIDQSGKKPELFAAGWKDRENKVPADPKALFKIASISFESQLRTKERSRCGRAFSKSFFMK